MSDSSTSSLILTFANSCIAIDYSGSRAAELIDFLYGFLPREQSGIPTVRFRLIAETENLFRLFQNQTLLAAGKDEAAIVEYLLGMSCYQLAATSVDGLLLHAAAVSWQQQGIILVGSSGAGKSTLTAWLLSRQFTYMTDELVFIPENTAVIDAFTRPLNLKKTSRAPLANLIEYSALAEGVISTTHIDLVSPLIFQKTLPQQRSQLQTIVFPNYLPGGDYECNKLSPAQTGLLLLQHVVNARNLYKHGFAQAVQLAKSVAAYEVKYANFEDLESGIQELKKMLEHAPHVSVL